MRDGVTVTRRYLDFTAMYDHYAKDWSENPESVFLMHFRWATHGSVSVKNCHPFPLAMGGALIHNGVLGIEGLNKDASDTKFFVKNIVDKLPEGWVDQPWWQQVLTKYIGYTNKVAMLFNDGRYLILNEKLGEWKDGVWYSNDSWKVGPSKAVAVVKDVADDDEADLFDLWSKPDEEEDDWWEWCPDCFELLSTEAASHKCDVVAYMRSDRAFRKDYGIVR